MINVLTIDFTGPTYVYFYVCNIYTLFWKKWRNFCVQNFLITNSVHLSKISIVGILQNIIFIFSIVFLYWPWKLYLYTPIDNQTEFIMHKAKLPKITENWLRTWHIWWIDYCYYSLQQFYELNKWHIKIFVTNKIYILNCIILDVNECQQNLHTCQESQRCDNTVGSYQCVRFTGCGTGYTLDVESALCRGQIMVNKYNMIIAAIM